jgi:DNA polymerase-3 subunit gamma/tau
VSSPTALYRRYRPDTFQDVIGQEHVTEPLMTALRKDRVNHAYLFSGPRGCGKTTSARILARCLNCEQGPTPEPCGVCPSCVELARGGAGSLDVIEIDAASHGGVDDARDLRERATFAPVRDRYKIFIIDEAHMVTSAGFNALLKIVEEPPEHIKFIFATTEPDKVIGTIRSRTHHYPFRLVPPEPLMAYLEKLCVEEHVAVEPGVLSLVVRAGGGSVRDSLSVLDQLMAGAGSRGIDYELAVALLGYTHAALLDDVIDAVAAGDSATVFRAVDRVIQTGHDPRRFVEDLLERFRDLIIVRALPDAAESILRGIPADQLARMRTQAQALGAAELSRAADVTNAAFNEMTGATSPRLHLELLCARLMLPGADSDHGVAARLDRLERRISFEQPQTTAAPAEAPAASVRVAPPPMEPTAPAEPQQRVEREEAPTSAPPAPTSAPPAPTSAAPAPTSAAPAPTSAPQGPTSAPQGPTSAPPAPTSAAQGATSGGAGSVEMFRRAWPEILDALTSIKRLTWILVSQNANVAGFDGKTLTLAFANSGSVNSFTRSDHPDNVRKAVQQVLGVDVQVDATVGGNGPSPAPARGAEAGPKAPSESPEDSRAPRPASASPSPVQERPSAPATPAAPAPAAAPTEADIAWGLAPVPAAPAPAPAPQAPAAQTPTRPQTEPPRPEAVQPKPTRPERPEAEPAPPEMAQPSRPGDPYADIPYADEEPPADWDEPLPEDIGARQIPTRSAPAPKPAPAPRPAPKPQAAPQSRDEPETTAASRDPWAYAQESSPGVWTVGNQPNTSGSEQANDSAPVRSAPAAAPSSYAPAAAQPPSPEQQSPPQADGGGERLSMYQRLSRRAAQQAESSAPVRTVEREKPQIVEDIPSADDETIEASGLFGRAAVERILGGKLIEERALDGTVIPPR